MPIKSLRFIAIAAIFVLPSACSAESPSTQQSTGGTAGVAGSGGNAGRHSDGGSGGSADGGTNPGGSGGGGDPGTAFCAVEELAETPQGDAIVLCKEAFSAPPLVCPPPDSNAGGVQIVYGGIGAPMGDPVLVSRDGQFPLSQDMAEHEAGVTDTKVRYGYFVYRAEVENNAVRKLTPVARIDDRVFMRRLAGLVLEGRMSARGVSNDEVQFDIDNLEVPVRIELGMSPAESKLDDMSGYPRFALYGKVANAHAAILASDGTCLRSTDTLGERDPFLDATGEGDEVMILRHPNMHGGFDDVFTLDWPQGVTGANNMGSGLFIPVSALIQSEAPTLTEANTQPHGVPWGGPSADLSVVTGGGEACTP
jgi:hypothetical protein